IDSLTLQSSFSSVRLESYIFTEESFQAVRDHLTPNGVMALYNYFREKWLVDRLANTVAAAFGEPPKTFVHEQRAYLAIMLAGPHERQCSATLSGPRSSGVFLLSGRRLHAARDQIDRAVRAALGIDLVVGVAGDRIGPRDGTGQHGGGRAHRHLASVAHSRRALCA